MVILKSEKPVTFPPGCDSKMPLFGRSLLCGAWANLNRKALLSQHNNKQLPFEIAASVTTAER